MNENVYAQIQIRERYQTEGGLNQVMLYGVETWTIQVKRVRTILREDLVTIHIIRQNLEDISSSFQ